MQYLDQKYITLLSGRLVNFKKKGPELYNFRCPLCHDSTKNKKKSRGYIYTKKEQAWFYCHNCGAALGFSTLLKKIDYALYSEYRLEKFKECQPHSVPEEHEEPPIVFEGHNELHKLKKISQLPIDHSARKWILDRKIPNFYHSVLRWTPAFKSFTNSIIPNKYSKGSLKFEEGRIIIPFFDQDGRFFAYQGRSIDASIEKGYRYISIVMNPEIPTIFGMDRISVDDKVYCMEGPLDSMFIPNSIAIAGGNFVDLADISIPKENIVLVYDNEPRSKETKKKIEHAIDNDYKVCIWPNHVKSKDVNDMILNENLTFQDIQYIIDKNTFDGFKAKLALSEWSRV